MCLFGGWLTYQCLVALDEYLSISMHFAVQLSLICVIITLLGRPVPSPTRPTDLGKKQTYIDRLNGWREDLGDALPYLYHSISISLSLYIYICTYT